MTVLRKIAGKYNSVLARLSLRTGKNLNKPTYICAKMTMRCNSRCAHCDIWKTEYDETELSTGEWFQALDDLSRWLGGFRMVFTGGEALLRDDMLLILDHAVRLGIQVELLSNGLILDERIAGSLVELGIHQITTSFDGISFQSHDRFRGETGYHALTCRAIEALRQARDERKKPLRILLKTVISRNNLTELTEIANWAWSRNLEVMYQPIEQNYGEEADRYWYRQSPWWIDDIPLLKESISALKALRSQGAPIVNSAEEFDTMVSYFESPDELMDAVQAHNTGAEAGQCPHAVSNFVLSSNGDVRMCFKMAPIGNISRQKPKEIWKNRARCWAGPCDYR